MPKDFYDSIRRPSLDLRELTHELDPDDVIDPETSRIIKRLLPEVSDGLVGLLRQYPGLIFHDRFVMSVAVASSVLLRKVLPSPTNWPEHWSAWFLDVADKHKAIAFPGPDDWPLARHQSGKQPNEETFFCPIHLYRGSAFAKAGNVVIVDDAEEGATVEGWTRSNVRDITRALPETPSDDTVRDLTYSLEAESMQGLRTRKPHFSCTNCLGIMKGGDLVACEFKGYGRRCTRCSKTNGVKCTFELQPAEQALMTARQIGPLYATDLVSLKEDVYKVLEQERMCMLDYANWKSSTRDSTFTEKNVGILLGCPDLSMDDIEKVIRSM